MSERSIIEAALCMASPMTPSHIRSNANIHLDQWTRADASWEDYLRLLTLLFPNVAAANSNKDTFFVERIAADAAAAGRGPKNDKPTVLGSKLLILQMFHAKISRDFRRFCSSCEGKNGDSGNGVNVNNGALFVETLADALQSSIINNYHLQQLNNAHNVSQSICLSSSLDAPICKTLSAVAVRSVLDTSDAAVAGSSKVSSVVSFALQLASGGSNSHYHAKVALVLLACLAEEADNVNDLTAAGKARLLAELATFVEPVLKCVHHYLMPVVMETIVTPTAVEIGELAVLSLKALSNWASTCHLTVSNLCNVTSVPELAVNGSTNEGHGSSINNKSLFFFLVHLLSQQLSSDNTVLKDMMIHSSRALTEAFIQPSDSCTPTRRHATTTILGFISQSGFLAAPLASSTTLGIDHVSYQVAMLASTIVMEEIDDIITNEIPGSTDILNLLLQCQSHPHQPVAIIPLEVWLTMQDVPLAERHADFGVPLFQRVLALVVERLAHHPNFTSWEEELDVDKQEFTDLRSLAKDVLISCYFLLRSQFIENMCSLVVSAANSISGWVMVESAMDVLCATSREICSRVTSKGLASKSIIEDKHKTSHLLVELARHIFSQAMSGQAQQQHILYYESIIRFLGCFAPVWNMAWNKEDVMSSLDYLKSFLSSSSLSTSLIEESAKSIRLTLINCSSKILALPTQSSNSNADAVALAMEPVLVVISSLMESGMSSLPLGGEEFMMKIAEGCTRLVCSSAQTSGNNSKENEGTFSLPIIRRSLNVVASPVLNVAQQSLEIIFNNSNSAATTTDHNIIRQVHVACQTLASSLRVIGVILRYSDGTITDARQPPLQTDIFERLWPTLNAAIKHPTCLESEDTVVSIFVAYTQLVNSIPPVYIIGTKLSELINITVQVFQQTFYPCTLMCVAAAVEVLGSGGGEAYGGETQQSLEDSFSQLLGHLICLLKTYPKQPNEYPQVSNIYL
mmetsp:Transcript_37192/g.43265  ORF Transcript_37192/g.43265 Transcript_37192/m.43265 type:complete len:970 (-) Transcript_37192:923-3832(-)|eukprot:CAMPEP_0194398334 /NCGR_PEP_ID=MMETSP0174-20130528/126045_1 /TAXON_ID=216777 /ORGANISM="Proboscia alata, Strain PI-D3" /LENGTH=969 /DNA_ID=CAMNT_0039194617 /DNA_START=467 /DNA_END=3376 /DNA_ORIENTATION=-